MIHTRTTTQKQIKDKHIWYPQSSVLPLLIAVEEQPRWVWTLLLVGQGPVLWKEDRKIKEHEKKQQHTFNIINKMLLTSWTVLSQNGWAANHSITPGSPWPPLNNPPWWCAPLWFSHAHLCLPTSSLRFPCEPSGLIQLFQIKQIQFC